MTLTKVITYIDEGHNELSFVPVKNVPGYTHRIVYNKKPINWLSEMFNPTEKTAAYFFSLEAQRLQDA
jgi:hypothetical protein